MVDTTGMRSWASSDCTIAGFTFFDVADEAELGVAQAGLDQPGVLAREADGERAVGVDGGDDVAVDLADEHHAGDVEGLGVGDAEAVAELGLLAEPLHEVADLGAAAVHDDDADADRVQQHDVGGEALGQGRVGHGVAAVLHDDGGAEELPDVGQRLDQHLGGVHVGGGRGHGRGRPRLRGLGAAHDVPMFSSM